MEIRVRGDEEVLVSRAEGRAVALDDVALDLVRVEVGGEKVVRVLLSEGVASVTHEACGCDPANIDNRREEVARALELLHAIVIGEDAAPDAVEDRVDPSWLRAEDRRGRKPLALLGEGDLDG